VSGADFERVRDDLDLARKRFATIVAHFALCGFRLDRIAGARGFVIERGLWHCEVPDLRSVCEFASAAGINLPREAAPP